MSQQVRVFGDELTEALDVVGVDGLAHLAIVDFDRATGFLKNRHSKIFPTGVAILPCHDKLCVAQRDGQITVGQLPADTSDCVRVTDLDGLHQGFGLFALIVEGRVLRKRLVRGHDDLLSWSAQVRTL